MRQALHIFKKDVHYLRREITLVGLIAMAFAAMHIPAFHASNNSWPAELALVAVAAFLIGRLVLAEAIPGRPAILDHAALSLAEPVDRKAPVHCRIRKSAAFPRPSVHPRDGRLPANC